MPSYITRAELRRWGFNTAALDKFSSVDQDDAILAASSELDDSIGSAYAVPLTSVPNSFKVHVARAATYHLMSSVGFDPDGPDGLILANYKMALKYFKDHGRGMLSANTNDIAPAVTGIPEIDSDADRGFSRTTV